MENGKYYRIGRPEIGQEHGAFRNRQALDEFLRLAYDSTCIPLSLFEIQGEIIHDDGGLDGLTVRVSNYRRIG